MIYLKFLVWCTSIATIKEKFSLQLLNLAPHSLQLSCHRVTVDLKSKKYEMIKKKLEAIRKQSINLNIIIIFLKKTYNCLVLDVASTVCILQSIQGLFSICVSRTNTSYNRYNEILPQKKKENELLKKHSQFPQEALYAASL